MDIITFILKPTLTSKEIIHQMLLNKDLLALGEDML